MLVVIDGRQPGLSMGATLFDVANFIVRHGGYTAANMDGGGTSTLVIEGAGGMPLVVNSPMHTATPGRERPGGNHLGVFAERLGE